MNYMMSTSPKALITVHDNRFDNNSELRFEVQDGNAALEGDDAPANGKCIRLSPEHFKLLSILNTTVGSLQNVDGYSALLYPMDIGSVYGHSFEKEKILEVVTLPGGKFRLDTYNMMGYIGCRDQKGNELQVRIRSRFDKGTDDYFMHYLLREVGVVNLVDMRTDADEDDIFSFLMFFFPQLLKEALNQGLYKEYVRHHYNDPNVRGPISVTRHLKDNSPFVGKVAYSTREHSYNNPVTQLIRHTIEFIRKDTLGETVLNLDRETRQCVEMIENSTPDYNPAMLAQILEKNQATLKHPYFTAYEPLRKLCVQILREEKVRYSIDDNSSIQIFGVLFDGAWLWEAYLATLLEPVGYTHPDNGLSTNGIPLCKTGGKRYPDFFRIDKGDVLDAKYRSFQPLENSSTWWSSDRIRDSIHQLVTYMYLLGSPHGALLYPSQQKDSDDVEPRRPAQGELASPYSGAIDLFGLEIPSKCDSFDDFCEKMRENESRFLSDMKKTADSGGATDQNA